MFSNCLKKQKVKECIENDTEKSGMMEDRIDTILWGYWVQSRQVRWLFVKNVSEMTI